MVTSKEIEDFYQRLGKGQITKEELQKYGLDGNLPKEEVKKMKGYKREIFEERNKMTKFYINYFTTKPEDRETVMGEYWKRERNSNSRKRAKHY